MFNKIGFGLALTAAFGLMACSSSSSSDNGKVTISCKVAKESPLTIKESAGIRGSVTIIYDQNEDGKMVVTYDFGSQSDADDECEDAQKGSEFEEVTCNGKKVVEVSSETATEKEFKDLVDNIKEDCIESDGQTVTIDKDGYIIDDDEEEGDGDEKDSGENVAASCDFGIDDPWEYSYVADDVMGKSSGTVKFKIDGKDFVSTTVTKTSGSTAATMCKHPEALAEMAGEDYEDEYISSKYEVSCEGSVYVMKIVSVEKNATENKTKEELYQQAKTSCSLYE